MGQLSMGQLSMGQLSMGQLSMGQLFLRRPSLMMLISILLIRLRPRQQE
jgi:hypothetical protein